MVRWCTTSDTLCLMQCVHDGTDFTNCNSNGSIRIDGKFDFPIFLIGSQQTRREFRVFDNICLINGVCQRNLVLLSIFPNVTCLSYATTGLPIDPSVFTSVKLQFVFRSNSKYGL